MATDSAEATPQAQPYAHRRAAFTFLLMAAFMNLVDLTIVNVGIPTIRRDLGASVADAEWIVAAYGLTFGLLLVTGGRLGDVYGRRPVFAVGVVGFTIGSALCGVAPSIGVLIGGRVLQAAFAALMTPQVLGSVGALFPPEERFKAMGMYGTSVGLAVITGPLLGALLVQKDLLGLQWRPMFLINIPVGLVAGAGALRLVPESRGRLPVRLDLTGVVMLSAALLLLMFPLVEGGQLGWPAWTFVAMIASVPALGLFAAYQSRRGSEGSPLLPMRLFRQAAFAGGVVVNLVLYSGVAGWSLVQSLTLQQGLGFTPLHAALTVVPFSIGIALASPNSYRLMKRIPGRMLVVLGTLTMACGSTITSILVHLAGPGLNSWDIVPGGLIWGLGFGAVIPILAGVILSRVDPRDAGVGAGVLTTVTQIGAAIGVAVIGAIFLGTLPAPDVLAAHPAAGYTGALGAVLLYVPALYATCTLLAALLLPGPAPAARPAPVESASTTS